MKSSEAFQLGSFQFDPSGPSLSDASQAIVPLRNQSLKVLDFLCQNTGRIVSKSEIYEQVWGDTFVTDASLVQCIRDIRRALQDANFSLVKTFPRQGYMIETTRPMMAHSNADLDGFIVAVCPFEDRSTGADQNILSDGIAEDLIVALSLFPELSVVSRQASFGFGAADNRTTQIVERTGAQYILSGFQQKSGLKLRVGVALIDATTDRNIWTESYELDAQDIIRSQREIVDNVSASMGYLILQFKPKSDGAGKAAAIAYHIRGRNETQKNTKESLARAEDLGRKSVKADPNSPYGYITLGFVHIKYHELGYWQNGPGDDLALADECAKKAIALAPNDPNPLMTQSVVFVAQGRLQEALICLEKALQLNPNNSANRMNYAMALALYGELPAALEQVEIVYKRHRVRPYWHGYARALVLWLDKQNQEALSSIRRVPGLPLDSIHCVLLASNGEVQAAQDEMVNFTAEHPHHTLKVERFIMGKKFQKSEQIDRWLAALKLA